jgi:phosphatidate cytidylyltransferase
MTSGTLRRIATAAVLIPGVIAGVWWGPNWLLAGLAALVAIIALIEFYALGEKAGFRAYRQWAYLAVIGIFAQQWTAARASAAARPGDSLFQTGAPMYSLDLILFLFLFGVAIIVLASRRPVGEVFSSFSVTAAGLLVIAIPFSTVVRLHGVDTIGRQLLLFTLIVVWVGDTAAYFAGRSVGRWKLAPHLSPNKTWEGAAANLLGALLVAAVFGRWMNIASTQMLAMAAVGSIAGQIGDIFESAFKRSVGAKDSGTLLPGHGGVLDRIDALIFAAPAIWYYFEWFVMRKI